MRLYIKLIFSYYLWAFLSLLQILLDLYSTKKGKSIFCCFYNITISGFIRAIGGLLALFIIHDALAIFYGVASWVLFISSVIIFIYAILATVIKKINKNVIHDYIQPNGCDC